MPYHWGLVEELRHTHSDIFLLEFLNVEIELFFLILFNFKNIKIGLKVFVVGIMLHGLLKKLFDLILNLIFEASPLRSPHLSE